MKPYYEHAGITIYCGDCRELLHSVGAFDALITDPPYGVEYHGSSTRHSARLGVGYTQFEDTPANIASIIVPSIAAALAVCARGVVTPGLANKHLYPKPDAEGVIWYPSGANCGSWGFITHQPIFYYGKCPYLAKGEGSRPTGFASTESAQPNGHPCPKPLGQMRWLVNRVARHGDSVLDPFCGSGTTLEAAKNLGIAATGIDIEERYCEIAAKRLSQEVMDFA